LLTVFSSSSEVPEQSLSRREDPTPPPLYHEQGHPMQPGYPPGDAKHILILSLPGQAKPPKANGWGNIKTFLMGTAATMAGLTILDALPWNRHSTQSSAPAPSLMTSSSPITTAPYNQYSPSPSTGQPQYQYQQRAVDHGKRTDFSEAHFDSESQSKNDVTDGVVTTAGSSEAKARSVSESDKNR
jgi:hypothetical protein